MTLTWNAQGNIFDHINGINHIPVIATNCIGVMGAGIAGQYRRYDERGYFHYRHRCNLNQHTVANPVMFVKGDKGLALCWATMRNPATTDQFEIIRAISAGVNSLNANLPNTDDHYTFHIPRLGCGIGDMDWGTVAHLLKPLVNITNHDFVIYGREPQ